MSIVFIMVISPILISIIFSKYNMIYNLCRIEYCKKINIYFKSYLRLLLVMTSEAIYELNIFQSIACIGFLNINLDIEYTFIPLTLRKVVFADYLEQIFYKDSEIILIKCLRDNKISPYMFNNIFTFLIMLGIGILIIIGIYSKKFISRRLNKTKEKKLSQKKPDENKEDKSKTQNEINKQSETMIDKKEKEQSSIEKKPEYNNEVEEKNELNIHLLLQKKRYKKCSLESIRSYLMFNYFIRVYQVYFCKLSLVLFYFLFDSITPSNKVICFFLLFFWVLPVPFVLLFYLRYQQYNLLAPENITFFGAFYIHYRGMLKDVFAFYIQILFLMTPIITSAIYKFPKVQIILIIIISLIKIIMISISMPFFKVTKIFPEILSEGAILAMYIILFVIIICPKANYDFVKYIYLSAFGMLFIFRLYRTVRDLISRTIFLYNFEIKENNEEFVEVKGFENILREEEAKNIIMNQQIRREMIDEIDAEEIKKEERKKEIIQKKKEKMLEIKEEEYFDDIDKQQLEKVQYNIEGDKAKKLFHFEASNRTDKKLIDETMDLFKEIKHDEIFDNCLGDTTIDASTIQMKKKEEKKEKKNKKTKKEKKNKTKSKKLEPVNNDNTKSINERKKITTIKKKSKKTTKSKKHD